MGVSALRTILFYTFFLLIPALLFSFGISSSFSIKKKPFDGYLYLYIIVVVIYSSSISIHLYVHTIIIHTFIYTYIHACIHTNIIRTFFFFSFLIYFSLFCCRCIIIFFVYHSELKSGKIRLSTNVIDEK